MVKRKKHQAYSKEWKNNQSRASLERFSKSKRGYENEIFNEKFKHLKDGFIIQITTCNKRVAIAINLETKEKIAFNRVKLEYMINKKIFEKV